jgi:rhodanese-related sulfurtransferase
MIIASANALVSHAEAADPGLSPADAAALAADPQIVMVDVREQAELDKTGTIRGAVHVPRSQLEFKADPASPSYAGGLAPEKRLVVFCASGKRAALSAQTLRGMGYGNATHVTGGGFEALRQAGAPIAG